MPRGWEGDRGSATSVDYFTSQLVVDYLVDIVD